jgi:hypothetical protein
MRGRKYEKYGENTETENTETDGTEPIFLNAVHPVLAAKAKTSAPEGGRGLRLAGTPEAVPSYEPIRFPLSLMFPWA